MITVYMEPERYWESLGYDADDQAELEHKLDRGELEAFNTKVVFSLYDIPLGEDTLFGSVYKDRMDFVKSHKGDYYDDMKHRAFTEAMEKLNKLKLHTAANNKMSLCRRCR